MISQAKLSNYDDDVGAAAVPLAAAASAALTVWAYW